MADILDVIKGSQKKINIEKLSALCSKKNVWDYFDIEREDFFELSKKRQLELTSEFYFDHVRRTPTIDDSIIHVISSSDGLNLKKDYDGDKTEMSIETSSGNKKSQKLLTCGAIVVFSSEIVQILTLKRQICQKTPLCTLIKGIKHLKILKNATTTICTLLRKLCHLQNHQKTLNLTNVKMTK